MVYSQNGYTANDISLTKVWLIPGTTRKIRLRADDCGFVLVHLAAWFDKAIETIDNDSVFDDWGYAERLIRGSETTVSNHASGTAMDLNATQHPLGVRNTFSDTQENRIRTQLKLYEGVIRWGGDYVNRADEMHFEINRRYSEVQRIARKIRGGSGGTVTAPNVTIAQAALAHAAAGGSFNPGDSYLADCFQFLAWGRALGAVPQDSENYWRTYYNGNTPEGGPTARQVWIQCVKWIQVHFGLTPDGIAGRETLSKMKAYGYVPIGLDGKAF